MLDKIVRALAAIRADVDALKSEQPREGPPGPSGEPGAPAPPVDLESLAERAAELIPTPKDGESPDPDAVAFKAAQLVPTPRDGKDAPPLDVIARAVVPLIPPAEKGDTGPRGQDAPPVDLAAVAAQVELPQPVKGSRGLRGNPGKSITNVRLKDNRLFVAIDGNEREVGRIDVPTVESFTPGDAGGGGAGLSKLPKSLFTGEIGNVIFVTKEADFGAAAGGEIQLQDATTYLVTTNIVMGNRIRLGAGTTLAGFGVRTSVLEYSGAGDFITVVDTGAWLRQIAFTCPNAQWINASSAASFVLITLDNVFVNACAKLGTLDGVGLGATYFTSFAAADGFTVTGADVFVFDVSKSALFDTDAGSSGFDITGATFDNFRLLDVLFAGAGVGLTGLPNGANINTGVTATVAEIDFSGVATPLGGITTSDVGWKFLDCVGVDNSLTLGETYHDGVTQTVPVSALGVFTSIGGAQFVDGELERFSANSAGVLTYLGLSAKLVVNGYITMSKSSGGADTLEARVGVNGVAVPNPGPIVASPEPQTIPVSSSIDVDTGDTIEIMVANLDGTNDIDIERVQLMAAPPS